MTRQEFWGGILAILWTCAVVWCFVTFATGWLNFWLFLGAMFAVAYLILHGGSNLTDDERRAEDNEQMVAFDQDARLRVRQIADEQNTSIYDVIRTLAEEAALNYFRGRSDDPARSAK